MASLFKISSVIYRIGLILSLPLYILALSVNDDETAVYHSSLKNTVFLSIVCLSVLCLTLYQSIEDRFGKLKRVFRLVSICMVSITLIFILKMFFDILYSKAHLVIGDVIANTVIFLFGLINASVLYGLFKKKI